MWTGFPELAAPDLANAADIGTSNILCAAASKVGNDAKSPVEPVTLGEDDDTFPVKPTQ